MSRLAIDAGARIIGGCCGTSPVHLAAMRAALDAHVKAARPTREEVVARIGPLVAPPVGEVGEKRSREGRRGREARRTARLQARTSSVAYITRQLPLVEVLSEEGLAIIEHNAETILQEIGIDFKEHPARDRAPQGGRLRRRRLARALSARPGAQARRDMPT